MNAFWMVYGEGQRAPAYKHETRESAIEEAQRLAGHAPGIRFYVLQTIGCAHKVAVTYTEIEDGVPF